MIVLARPATYSGPSLLAEHQSQLPRGQFSDLQRQAPPPPNRELCLLALNYLPSCRRSKEVATNRRVGLETEKGTRLVDTPRATCPDVSAGIVRDKHELMCSVSNWVWCCVMKDMY